MANQRIGDSITSMTVSGLIDENNRLKKELAERRPTIRDQFAMAAITGIVPMDPADMDCERHRQKAAYRAYDIADAMLAEREKGVKG